MSDKFKNSKFYQAMKNPKVSRAIYISMVLVLVAIAVVIGITVAANRTKKPAKEPDSVTTTPSTNDTSNTPNGTEEPNDTQTPDDTTGSSGPVSKPLPTFSLPTKGNVTEFHDAEVQIYSDTMNDYRIHLGIDIATLEGAPVYAAADGEVSKVWSDPMMGYCVAVSHGGDSVTIYKNLAKDLASGIKAGASVKVGQQIGNVGNSAMVEVGEDPHLHFEMTVGGLQVDPLEYFSAKDVASLGVDESYGD